MTAPLPPATFLNDPAAMHAAARTAAKPARPQAFALPDVLPEPPEGASPQAKAEPGATAAPEEQEMGEPLPGQPAFAAPPSAPPPAPAQLLAAAFPSPGPEPVPPALPASAPPASALPEADSGMPGDGAPAHAARLPAAPTPPGMAAGAAGEPAQTPPPPAARPREGGGAPDRLPPGAPVVSASASATPPAATAAATPMSASAGRDASPDSRQSSPGRDEPSPGRDGRPPARGGAASPPAGQASVQMPPFRMEAAPAPPQAAVPGAVISGNAASPGAFAAFAPDMAGDTPLHTPDVVVELVGADALDVTISAATPESLDRLSAAEPELRHELARLGAEVEAIRVELRADSGSEKPGPDKGQDWRSADRGADGASALQPDDGPSAEGRQGDRMMRQNDLRETRVEGRRIAGSALRPGAGAETGALRAAGRIDRYA